MASIIQLRNDTAANWALENPILAEGEVGIETDTRKLKVGDGELAWEDLPYMVAGDGGGSSTGGSGPVEIGDLYVKNSGYDNSLNNEKFYKGRYSDIMFTLNCDKDTLVANKDDLYFTIEKNSRNNQNNTPIFTSSVFKRQNDRRVKLDKRLYCWRYPSGDGAHPEYGCNPLTDGPYHPNYIYFYTESNYNDDPSELLDTSFTTDIYYGKTWEAFKRGLICGNMCTCFNALDNNPMTLTAEDKSKLASEVTIYRYENGDIDTFVKVANVATPGVFDPNLVEKMICRKYKVSGNNVFLWCQDWDDATADVYGSQRQNYIPKHMDELDVLGDVSTVLTSKVFVERRNDLDYYYWPNNVNFQDFINHLYNNTHFKKANSSELIGKSVYPKYRSWHTYWFDFPIMPVRLAECEILDKDGKTWVKLDDILTSNTRWAKIKDLTFRLPYDTHYLWMRRLGWQKQCYYYDDSKRVGPKEKTNIVTLVRQGSRQSNFGSPHVYGTEGPESWMCSRQYSALVKFSIVTAYELIHNKKGKGRALEKRMKIYGTGVNALQNITN